MVVDVPAVPLGSPGELPLGEPKVRCPTAAADNEPQADSHWRQLVEELPRPLTAAERRLGRCLTPAALRKVGGLLAAGVPAALILAQLAEAFSNRPPRPPPAGAADLEDQLGRPLSDGEAAACGRLSDHSFHRVRRASAEAGVEDPEELLADVRRYCFARRSHGGQQSPTSARQLPSPLPELLAAHLPRDPTAAELRALAALSPAGAARLGHALRGGAPAEACLAQLTAAFAKAQAGPRPAPLVLEAVDVYESDGEGSDQDEDLVIE
eukprot:EG_transcript_18101